MAVEDRFYGPDGLEASAESIGMDRPDVSAYRALAEDLRDRVTGGVQFDEYA